MGELERIGGCKLIPSDRFVDTGGSRVVDTLYR